MNNVARENTWKKQEKNSISTTVVFGAKFESTRLILNHVFSGEARAKIFFDPMPGGVSPKHVNAEKIAKFRVGVN